MLDHPRTGYLREADLLPYLDGWLTGPFDTANLEPPLDALIAASQDASGAAERCARSSGRWPTASASSPRYRAALDTEAMISAASAAHGTSREHLT
jgi:hypothetical protein